MSTFWQGASWQRLQAQDWILQGTPLSIQQGKSCEIPVFLSRFSPVCAVPWPGAERVTVPARHSR